METTPFAYIVLLAAFSLAVFVVAWVVTRRTRAAAAGPRVSVDTDRDRIACGGLDGKMEADGQRVGEIAHDLNDLLTAITGHTELLIASLDPTSTTILDAYEVRRAALSAAQLTGALRTLSGGRGNVAETPLAFEASPTIGPAIPLEPRVDTRPLARVLVVEDEPGVRELIRVVLVKAGYDVVTVPGPRAALAALAREPAIDVLLVDVVMPEMDGYDLVAEARPLLPHVQVVFISAFARDPKRHVQGDSFLEKPFTPQALTDIVKASLMGSER
jgi:CheY-like chemotaxis protein